MSAPQVESNLSNNASNALHTAKQCRGSGGDISRGGAETSEDDVMLSDGAAGADEDPLGVLLLLLLL